MKEVTSVLEFANAAAIERINYELVKVISRTDSFCLIGSIKDYLPRFRVDAYKKWENFCVNGAGERQ